MDAEKCLGLLGGVKSLSVATVDGSGAAQVRVIDMELHEGRLYFLTARGKDFYRELERDETVGIVGMTRDWEMIRMTARVKKAERSYLDMIYEKSPGMNDVYPGESRAILEAFCVASGQGEWFDLSGRKAHVMRGEFAFGGDAEVRKGYRITENCMYCGACARSCPQKCIVAGEPFRIIRENCLHCGLCAEVCPAEAVERLER